MQDKNKAVVDNNLLPPNCNLDSCLGLTGEITCIISAIASGDSTALQNCLSNSVSEVCKHTCTLFYIHNDVPRLILFGKLDLHLRCLYPPGSQRSVCTEPLLGDGFYAYSSCG